MIPLLAKLADYQVYRGGKLPPVRATLYEYWLAGSGIFVRAARPGLEALVPVAWAQVRGLPELDPYVRFTFPRLPNGILSQILTLSRAVCEHGQAYERLFHLWYVGDRQDPGYGWHLTLPPQWATATKVQPMEDGEGSSYANALIEVHSHHGMAAFFSTDDDKDEQGFRLYGVIGNIWRVPTFRLRVGVYGYFMDVEADSTFDMPREVVDGLRSYTMEISA